MGLLNQPKLARTAKQGLMSPLEIQMDTMVYDPLRPNLSSRLTQQDLVNKGLLAIGMAPMGITKAKTVYELAHEAAQKNAAKMLGLPKNNTAMDRAKAMGFDIDAYHGTNKDVPVFDPKRAQFARENAGTWFSEHPEFANSYAGRPGGNVMPVKIRNKKLAEVDFQGKNWNSAPDDTIVRSADGTDFMPSEYFSDAGNVTTNDISRLARHEGNKGLRVFNVQDAGGYGAGVGNFPANADNIAIHDPSLVRSRFAAFDPARAAESDLLAGLAPYLGIGGLLGLGYYGDNGNGM